MITTQDCAECVRLALLDALRSAMQTARENGLDEKASEHWDSIQYHQRHQWRHTCEEAGADHE